MNSLIKYTSIDRVFTRINRVLPTFEISESDLIEWSGEALDGIGVDHLVYPEEHVVFLEVKDFQAKLPPFIFSIIEVARDNQYVADDKCPTNVCIEDVQKEIVVEETEKDCPVPIDCDGKPLTGVDVAYYRPFFDLLYEYHGWSSSRMYQQRFTPVRLSTHAFFNDFVCKERQGIYDNCKDEYQIINNGSHLRFSFQEGFVAVAVLKYPLENGFPLIPDNQSFLQAIEKYIIHRVMQREYYAGNEGFERKMDKSEDDWQWYCGQASNNAKMIKGVDAYQNFLSQWQHIIPPKYRYNNFFGRLNEGETRIYNTPRRFNRGSNSSTVRF